MWEMHYIHRAFIYPFSITSPNRPMPVSIALTSILFNAVNAYLNGRFLFSFTDSYSTAWLTDYRFIAGAAVFAVGFYINRQSDNILTHLRTAGDDAYRIPRGGMFNLVSCPNYLGEILIWTGWAVATWSLPGLAFAAWTVANLAPRARFHHQWYREQFPDYPEDRKALIPRLW